MAELVRRSGQSKIEKTRYSGHHLSRLMLFWSFLAHLGQVSYCKREYAEGMEGDEGAT